MDFFSQLQWGFIDWLLSPQQYIFLENFLFVQCKFEIFSWFNTGISELLRAVFGTTLLF